MPDSVSHTLLTRAALALQPFPKSSDTRLETEYCLYPDDYFSARWREIAPYCPFKDGIQFHYLPDTPWNPLYRYWRKDEEDSSVRVLAFDNPNFRHAHAGFEHCIGHAVREFRAGRVDEGNRHLGVLLHVLQDATFGIHALEGPGGADLGILDRLLDTPLQPTELLAEIRWQDEGFRMDYRPQSLGATVDEMVMRLYSAYCQAVSSSRKLCVRYVLESLNGKGDGLVPLVRSMGETSIRLCADVIHTVRQLAEGMAGEQPDPLPLETQEPFEFPFGGFRPYRFRSVSRDCVPSAKGSAPLPLQIGSVQYSHGLAFGSHYEGRLLYWIAPGVFQSLTATIGMHPAFLPVGSVQVTVLNDGQERKKLTLDATTSETVLMIPEPGNVVGLVFHSTPSCGVIVLGSPELHRAISPKCC